MQHQDGRGVILGHRRHYRGPNARTWPLRGLVSDIVRCQNSRGPGRRPRKGAHHEQGAPGTARGRTTTGRLLGAAVLAVALIIGAVAFRLAGGPTPAALDSDASGTIPLLGSSVLSPANLTRTTAQFGHMPIVRVYFPGLPGHYAWTSIAGVNKSAVIVSFKARPALIRPAPTTRGCGSSSPPRRAAAPSTTATSTSPRTTSPAGNSPRPPTAPPGSTSPRWPPRPATLTCTPR